MTSKQDIHIKFHKWYLTQSIWLHVTIASISISLIVLLFFNYEYLRFNLPVFLFIMFLITYNSFAVLKRWTKQADVFSLIILITVLFSFYGKIADSEMKFILEDYSESIAVITEKQGSIYTQHLDIKYNYDGNEYSKMISCSTKEFKELEVSDTITVMFSNKNPKILRIISFFPSTKELNMIIKNNNR